MDEKDDRGADFGAASSAWRANTWVFTMQNIEVKIVSILIVVCVVNLKVRVHDPWRDISLPTSVSRT